MLRISEFQSAPYQSNLMLHRDVMPPLCVGLRGDQANDGCPSLGCFVCLLQELLDSVPIGWIHPANGLAPILNEAIIFLRKEAIAFGIVRIRTNVQREPKLPIQSVKQSLRRRPVVCFADGLHVSDAGQNSLRWLGGGFRQVVVSYLLPLESHLSCHALHTNA